MKRTFYSSGKSTAAAACVLMTSGGLGWLLRMFFLLGGW